MNALDIPDPLVIFDPLALWYVMLLVGLAIASLTCFIGAAMDYRAIRHARMSEGDENTESNPDNSEPDERCPVHRGCKHHGSILDDDTAIIPRLAYPPKTIGFDVYV